MKKVFSDSMIVHVWAQQSQDGRRSTNGYNDLKSPQAQARDYLIYIYLDWVNNYATLTVFAEHNGLTVEHAQSLLDLAQSVFESPHPES